MANTGQRIRAGTEHRIVDRGGLHTLRARLQRNLARDIHLRIGTQRQQNRLATCEIQRIAAGLSGGSLLCR